MERARGEVGVAPLEVDRLAQAQSRVHEQQHEHAHRLVEELVEGLLLRVIHER